MHNFEINKSNITDLDKACDLFNDAIAYQTKKGYPRYRCDDRVLQKEDILKGQHFKVTSANHIAAIFSMWFEDAKIWRERDQGQSIYLHRVVTNQAYKGLGILKLIIDWVAEYARMNRKSTLRIDTWDNNPDLVQYYIKHGFRVVEYFAIPDTDDMPVNCRGNAVVLMEYDVV